MAAILPVILAGAHLFLVADRVPQLDIAPSCRAVEGTAAEFNRNEANCVRQENNARDKLTNEWGQFSDRDRAHCTQLSNLGGYPSYVELLTCLELGQEAERLPADGLAGATRVQ